MGPVSSVWPAWTLLFDALHGACLAWRSGCQVGLGASCAVSVSVCVRLWHQPRFCSMWFPHCCCRHWCGPDLGVALQHSRCQWTWWLVVYICCLMLQVCACVSVSPRQCSCAVCASFSVSVRLCGAATLIGCCDACLGASRRQCRLSWALSSGETFSGAQWCCNGRKHPTLGLTPRS